MKRIFFAAAAALALALATPAIAQPDNRLFPRGVFWQGCHEDYENIRALVETSGIRAYETASNLGWGTSVPQVQSAMASAGFRPSDPYQEASLLYSGFHQNGSAWRINFGFDDSMNNPQRARLISLSIEIEGDETCVWSATE